MWRRGRRDPAAWPAAGRRGSRVLRSPPPRPRANPPTPALSPRQQPSLAGVLEIPGAHLRRFLGRAGLHFRGCSLKDGWGSSLAG